jgi:hypothetical protein
MEVWAKYRSTHALCNISWQQTIIATELAKDHNKSVMHYTMERVIQMQGLCTIQSGAYSPSQKKRNGNATPAHHNDVLPDCLRLLYKPTDWLFHFAKPNSPSLDAPLGAQQNKPNRIQLSPCWARPARIVVMIQDCLLCVGAEVAGVFQASNQVVSQSCLPSDADFFLVDLAAPPAWSRGEQHLSIRGARFKTWVNNFFLHNI